MNVLSLFDGISVGQLALQDANIKIDNYYASEINNKAIKITQYNFPNTIQLGDVQNWKNWNIDWSSIDMLIGGSPCFVAGTRVKTKNGYKNIEDIKVGDEVLTHKNRWRKVLRIGNTPNQEIWEIISMDDEKFLTTGNHPFMTTQIEETHYTDVIFKQVKDLTYDDLLVGHLFKPESSNKAYKYTKIVSIRKTNYRETVYNIEVEEDHTYVVETKIVHNCQNLSFAGNQEGLDGEKSSLFYVYRDILNHLKNINPNILFLLENVKCKQESLDIITKEMGITPIRINSNLVSAQNRDRYYWTNINNGDICQPKDLKIILNDILRVEDDGNYPLSKKHYEAFLKSYPNWKDSPRDGKAKPLLASYYKQPPHCPYIRDTKSESGYRRLSPIECERCQTLPDNYTLVDGISKSARWECIGNGWTMKVISHIFQHIKE